jgi:quercetin dioxygenase-like cupin family protein
MNAWMRSLAVAAALALATLADAQESPPVAESDAEGDQAVVRPAAEIEWTDATNVKGARAAVLWGDPKAEGYGQLNRWPGGAEIPLHWHPFETRAVVLEGTLTVGIEGRAMKELGPGSYLHLPGRVAHVTTCKPGAECVFLTTSRLRYETRMGAPKAGRTR